MHRQGVGGFKYYVGTNSLAELAAREDRVCVLNILGSESRGVTPASHEYSGGNVVFGTSPGREGQVLKTRMGDIPVFNDVRNGLDAGHNFNTGVVYLPPAGVRDGVAELVRVNPDLKKVIVLTEKVSVHDARIIRAIAQLNGIDVFGANSLGLADAWNHVRLGGALGGSNPAESLKKGTVAIFSNSGNFTTTIAVYLATAGWGTTVSISSGKDLYIHFAAPEFAHALANDDRTRAAVMYVEPGGYYEQGLVLSKPTVACVVGRWKAKLTRAVGHAGAMAGSGDDAAAKEEWFMEMFGVDSIFEPGNPVCSAKGAVVTNIAHIPDAMTAVMKLNGAQPDFDAEGSLSLKPWFGNTQGLDLPDALTPPVVEAVAPYNEQIEAINRQVGTIFPRQSMKDTSGASLMDPKTQVSRIHGVSVLDATRNTLESNLALAIVREPLDDNGETLANVAIAAEINLHGSPLIAAADASREAGNAPNSVLAAACSIVGPKRVEAARKAADTLLELFASAGLSDATDESFDCSAWVGSAVAKDVFLGPEPDPKAQAMLEAIDARAARSTFVKFLRALGGNPTADAVLAAITTTLAWGPLSRKRISTLTVRNLPWYMRLYGVLIGAATDGGNHSAEGFCGVANAELLSSWSVTEVAYLALMGERPNAEQLFPFRVLLGLIITNGPGTISAQGAKGGVAADGPESPDRVQINKAMAGFLTHTGFAHGGNAFEAIAFLVERFEKTGLSDPTDAGHGLDLPAMAGDYALTYKKYKAEQQAIGNLGYDKIPCINHPVFKNKPVNHDPREVYVAELFAERGEYNVFHDYYHALVQALFDKGVSENVYCVNVDAVIAVLLLKILWQPYRAGDFSEHTMESAAFTIFLFGRMIGCAAEVEDHINRGRNMDTRTPASQCGFVD
jgi:succinyl-CoA synthetase alpha subunit